MAGDGKGGASTDDLEAAFFHGDRRSSSKNGDPPRLALPGAETPRDDAMLDPWSVDRHAGSGPVGSGPIPVAMAGDRFDETRPLPVARPSPAGNFDDLGELPPTFSAREETQPYPLAGGLDPGVLGAKPAPPKASPVEEEPRPAPPPPSPPATPLASPLPFAPPLPPTPPVAPTPEETAAWKGRIDALLKEARAQEGAPSAAPLWFEAGRIYENELKNLREAAAHYQEANKTDPTFLPVIHAVRRLFAQLGKWNMVVVLLDEELKLEGAPRAALLVEKGRIHETKLGKPEVAMALYKQALEAAPGHPPAVDALARHLGSQSDRSDLAEVLESAALGAPDDRKRRGYLLELARHYESRVGDLDKAVATFEKARALAPDDHDVLTALRRLYTRKGDEDALAELLAAAGVRAKAPSEAVQLMMERAAILERRGEVAGAIAALVTARKRAPSDTLVLTELVRLYERTEAWRELADAYLGLVDATQDKSERVAIHAEAGALCAEKLGDTDRAVAHYRACILADPTYQPAISALGKLFARRQMWPELSDIYEVQLRATTDEAQRVPLLFKQAELLADQIGDVDLATEKLLEVLAINPGYVPALKLVSSLYMRRGRWLELIQMYEGELEGQEDKDQAIFLLEKIGSIAENELGDVERAVASYRRMLDWIPGYLPALRSLGRLYAKTERWHDLIQINVEESQIVGDQNHVVSLLTRNGDIYAEKLDDTERAIENFQKALTLLPNFLPALKALGAIYAKAGRWEDLIRMHRQEAEVARQPEHRAALLFTVAQIYAAKLADTERAARTYRELLEERPGYHPALRELARIAEATGDWEGLAQVYEKEIAVLRDPRDRAVLRVRMADLYERRLSRAGDAVDILEAAVADAKGLLVAHERLIAILYRVGDGKAEARARERMHEVLPDEGSRLANLRALADLYLYALGEPENALGALRRLLALAPEDRDALRAAMGCALQRKDYASAIQHAEALASVEPDAEEVANLHLQVASWKEGHLEPPQDALGNYLKALEYSPQDPVALRAAERAYVQRQAWEGLYLLYERERAGTSEPVRIADLSMKMGELGERRLGNVDLACEEYEAALKARPDHLPAIIRLKALYGSSGTPEQQLRMLAFEAQASKDPARAIQTLLEVGALQRDRFGNVDAAIESYFQVLARDPLHHEAFQALEGMLVAHGRFDRLVELLKGRALAVTDPAQRTELLGRAAHVAQERLSDPARAAEIYEAVLRHAPQNATALAQLGHIRFDLGQYDEAVQCFAALTQVLKDPQKLAPVHLRLGIIFTDHRADPGQAIASLQACLAVQPENREARRRLAVAYAQAGDARRAVETHQQLVDKAGTPEEQLEARLAMADLYEGPLKEPARAAQQVASALDLVRETAQRLELLQRVAMLFERAGDLDGYLKAADEHARAIERLEPLRAAEILARSASLVLQHKKDIDRAIALARRGLDLAPDYTDLRGFLADVYTDAPSQGIRAVEEHRRILSSGAVRVPSIRALYRMWTSQRASDRAFVASELLVFLKQAAEDEELFYGENRTRVSRDTDEELGIDEVTGWLVHPDQRNVAHEILAAVSGELGKVDPDDLSLYEVDKKDVLTRRSDDPLRNMAESLARNLGGVTFDVYRTRAKPFTVEAHNAQPLALVVGADVTRSHPTREQRFLLGRKLMALRCGHHLVAGMDAVKLAGFLSAIGRAVDKGFPAIVDRPDLDLLAKRINSALSRSTKKLLAEPIAQLAEVGKGLDLDAFLGALRLTEARAGMLLCGDTAAAFQLVSRDGGGNLQVDPHALIGAVERDPLLSDLVAYCLSDEYFVARQKLRLAIDA